MDFVTDDQFSRLDEALALGGAPAAFSALVDQLRAAGQHSHVFETRLMQRRHEWGLPLAAESTSANVPAERRAEWDAFVMESAREAGEAYLAAGNLGRAWPYFRALGESGPVREAIEKLPASGAPDDAIEVALYERVHPVKGYEMILATHGSCRAITCMDQYPDPDSREAALDVLTRSLHEELTANLVRTIEKQEGNAPADRSMPALLAGRDWLFGEYDYYIDTSHLLSALRFAVESTTPAVWRRALDFAEYGKKLGTMFQYPGEPPFARPCHDNAMFLRGLLGIDTDASVAHFRHIAETVDPERVGSYPAQVLVRYLLRLQRPQEAIEVFEQHLRDADPQYLSCPNLTQLCQIAGDYERLRNVARERNDVLSYLAGHLLAVKQPSSSASGA